MGGLFLHVAIFNIRSQWQDHEILILVIRMYYLKLDHILKSLVLKFRSDLFARLRSIAEKRVPAKLKPIVGFKRLGMTDPDLLA